MVTLYPPYEYPLYFENPNYVIIRLLPFVSLPKPETTFAENGKQDKKVTYWTRYQPLMVNSRNKQVKTPQSEKKELKEAA
jgi:hypothetical protein